MYFVEKLQLLLFDIINLICYLITLQYNMNFCYNFVEVLNKQGSLNFFIDFHIQFVVWIICGIKNIMKMNCNYVCNFFTLYFGLQVLIIINNHEYGVLMHYK
jgi:hypothetical protein